MQEVLQKIFLGNRVLDYFIASLTFLSGVLIILILKKFLVKSLKVSTEKSKLALKDSFVKNIKKNLLPLSYYGVFYFSLRLLTLHPNLKKLLDIVGGILLTFYGVRILLHIIIGGLDSYLEKQENYETKKKLYTGLFTLIKLIIWALAIFIFLDNAGVKITPLIAGLGIGGITVALASQAILADLFNYFVILFDRPFEAGDFIILDNYMGTVEYIGIKTTRIRSLSGEQLIIPNTHLTNSRILNSQRMEKRRVVFRIGVTYQTSVEKLKEIPQIIEKIIKAIDGTEFDRAHFSSYGDFSLIFEVAYYILSRDYKKYMDIQQEINLRIKEEFEKRGIEFAYPTQTLFVYKAN